MGVPVPPARDGRFEARRKRPPIRAFQDPIGKKTGLSLFCVSSERHTLSACAGAEGEEVQDVRVCVAIPLAVSPLASLSVPEGDPVPLRQPIEGAPVDAEELSGELLVPPCLLQHAAEVASYRRPERQG